MAASMASQGLVCHERSASMQEGQSTLGACSTSYSEAHGRLQTDPGALHTITVSVHRPIDPYRFNMFMSDLLAERGSDIKEMHGILSIQGYGDHGTHFKFEGAQQTVRFGPTVGTATDSHVTFCGHQLIAKDLQEALDSCTWLPVVPGWTEHFAPGVHQPFYFHQATRRKQWHRPAPVETEPAISSRCQSQSPVTVLSPGATAQLVKPSPVAQDALCDGNVQRGRRQKRNRPPARSAVSCPCDASDACAAVFDIKCQEDQRTAKRVRNGGQDVTSRLADCSIDADMRDFGSSIAIIDSASELEASRVGQGKLPHRKLGANIQARHDKQQVKEPLRRSSSCPWTPKQSEHVRKQMQC
ncbi:hypothetical protein ABBQ38_001135 [Trebouxia sp. C0009 RCD-2024]